MKQQKLNKFLQRQIFRTLGLAMAEKSPTVVNTIIDGLTTIKERDLIAKRLSIAIFLDKGRSYENICDNLQVSASEIAWVAERMDHPGIQQAVLEIKAEQWSDHWSKQIMRLLGKT